MLKKYLNKNIINLEYTDTMTAHLRFIKLIFLWILHKIKDLKIETNGF